MYYEAFLTTYRTYISPHELLEKLLRRYNTFGQKAKEYNSERQINIRTQRNAFFLILRVVEELWYVIFGYITDILKLSLV